MSLQATNGLYAAAAPPRGFASAPTATAPAIVILRWASVFFVAGVLILLLDGSWRMSFIQRAEIIQVGSEEFFAAPDWSALPLVSRLLAMGAWALIFAASFIALAGGAHRALPGVYLFLYSGMWFVAGYLLIGLTTDPLDTLTTGRGLMGKMAPGTLLGIGVFFLAAHPEAWRTLKKGLLLLAAATCLTWLFFALHIPRPSRAESYRWIFEPTLLLEMVALLPLGFIAGRGGVRSFMRFAPLLLLALATVLLQARLLVVILFVLCATYGWLRARAGALHDAGVLVRLYYGIFMLLPALALLLVIAWPLAESTLFGESAQRFWERRAEDTRTRQVAPFFEKATPMTLLVGAGYPAKDEYNAEGAGGIDMGYLNTMYVTGLPMVLLLVGMLIVPVFLCLRRRLAPADAAVAATALAFAVRLLSSTIPAFSAQFLVACVLMGRCAWLAHAADPLADASADSD